MNCAISLPSRPSSRFARAELEEQWMEALELLEDMQAQLEALG